MKALIIAFCVVVANVQAADVLQEMIGQTVAECREQVQAKSEDMMQLLQQQPIVSTSAKCFLACIAKKFKFMNAVGEVNEKVAKDSLKFAKLLGEDIFKKISVIVDTCLSQVQVGGNECDVAYSFYTCGMNEAFATNLPNLLLGSLL